MLVPFYLAPPSASAPVLTLTPDDIAAVATAVWATCSRWPRKSESPPMSTTLERMAGV